MAKTIVALYDEFDTAQDVLEDLLEAGFSRENVSLMASDASGDHARRYTSKDVSEDVSAGEGAGFGAVVGTLIGLGVALIPGIGPVLGAGPLAVALTAGIGAAAGAITGGITAALVDLGVDEEDAGYYAEGLRRGGTLVSVTVDDAWIDRAEDIMNRHHPVDIDHRAAYWRETGWSEFSTESTPYSADEITRDRTAYGDYSTRARSTTGMGSTSPGDSYSTQERRSSFGPTETPYNNVDETENRQTVDVNTYGTGSESERRTRVYDTERQ
jgi:uncharacterized membrane protein